MVRCRERQRDVAPLRAPASRCRTTRCGCQDLACLGDEGRSHPSLHHRAAGRRFAGVAIVAAAGGGATTFVGMAWRSGGDLASRRFAAAPFPEAVTPGGFTPCPNGLASVGCCCVAPRVCSSCSAIREPRTYTGVPQLVALGEVCVPLLQPAIVPSTSSPTSDRSARFTTNTTGRRPRYHGHQYGSGCSFDRDTALGSRCAPPRTGGTVSLIGDRGRLARLLRSGPGSRSVGARIGVTCQRAPRSPSLTRISARAHRWCFAAERATAPAEELGRHLFGSQA